LQGKTNNGAGRIAIHHISSQFCGGGTGRLIDHPQIITTLQEFFLVRSIQIDLVCSVLIEGLAGIVDEGNLFPLGPLGHVCWPRDGLGGLGTVPKKKSQTRNH
jgi:hypothetical protein